MKLHFFSIKSIKQLSGHYDWNKNMEIKTEFGSSPFPKELWFIILLQLSITDIKNFSLVAKFTAALFKQQTLWFSLLKRDFNIHLDKNSKINPQVTYQERLHELNAFINNIPAESLFNFNNYNVVNYLTTLKNSIFLKPKTHKTNFMQVSFLDLCEKGKTAEIDYARTYMPCNLPLPYSLEFCFTHLTGDIANLLYDNYLQKKISYLSQESIESIFQCHYLIINVDDILRFQNTLSIITQEQKVITASISMIAGGVIPPFSIDIKSRGLSSH